MSWHCLFCGNPEVWMRGKEHDKGGAGMVELFFNDGLGGKKISLGVCHADCLQRVLKDGQYKLMENGELTDFEELEEFK